MSSSSPRIPWLLKLGLAGLLAVLTLAPQSAAHPEPIPEPVAELSGSAATATAVADGTFPTARTTGVPQGWVPQRTVRGDVRVTDPGAEISDLRIIRGDLLIEASDVTVRRVDVRGGRIENFSGATCQTGLRILDSTVRRAPGQQTSGDRPVIATGGYLADGVKIVGVSEGFRVGGKDACGGVEIRRSFVRVLSPDICGDWHGDALQGYDGGRLVLRDSVLKLVERDACGGTAPFFYPEDQGNTSVDVDGLVVSGGGFSFRLGRPESVRRLFVEEGSSFYGPIDVRCAALSTWDASIAVLGSDGQPRETAPLPCVK